MTLTQQVRPRGASGDVVRPVGAPRAVRSGFVPMLLGVTVAYVALAGSSIGLATIQWDELTDLRIASALIEHPFTGNSLDGSQARLPMYVMAGVYRSMISLDPEAELSDALVPARWVSVFMTVLAIWFTYLLGSRLFTAATGFVAAALFALSPFVLHFGRDALTQGDAFTPAAVLLALLAFERFDRLRDTPSLVWSGISLGFVIATKFLLVVLIPALIVYHLLASARWREGNGRGATSEPPSTPRRYLGLATGTGVFALIALLASLARGYASPDASPTLFRVAALSWAAAVAGIAVSVLLAVQGPRSFGSAVVTPAARWRLGGAWLAIVSLACATSLALFPAHVFNRAVLQTLFERLVTMDGGPMFAATPESARLYSGIILLKLGLPFGFATGAALLWAAGRALENRQILLVMLVLAFYAALLALLPLQQPFWLMSVYPLLTLMLAALIVRGLGSARSLSRVAWGAGTAFAFAWLLTGVVRVYPTFGYYGYETTGERWLGGVSRGYREVVVVTNDGSAEAVDWLRNNVPEGSNVLSYLDDIPVVRFLTAGDSPSFEIRHALQFQDEAALAEQVMRADYAIVRPIDDLPRAFPLAQPTFVGRFGAAPVHQVFRGRGIYRTSVMQIYAHPSRADGA
jgi:hypothetical protein